MFSPYRSARYALLVATAMEAAVSPYAGFVWFAPLLLDR